MTTKNIELGIRFSKIRDLFCHGKNKEFAERLGISVQNACGYCNGRTAIGDKLVERVLDAFPQVSRVWLYLGEGDILKQDPSGAPTPIAASHPLPEPQIGNDMNRLITIIENKDRQMERLICMLEYKMDIEKK